jgi:hypothetical protein
MDFSPENMIDQPSKTLKLNIMKKVIVVFISILLISVYGKSENAKISVDHISIPASGDPVPFTNKTLNISYLFLEGLYAGGGMMNKAQDENGPHFPGNTADQVTVELHNSTNYSTIEYSAGNVNLATNGTLTVSNIPGSLSGSCYITIRHRNSITTTSAQPVDFSGTGINYAFDAITKAYGNNMKIKGDGTVVIYCGDVNQDGIVDGGDLAPIDNANYAITFGYIPADVNGDGIVDSGDMNITSNNSNEFVEVKTP